MNQEKIGNFIKELRIENNLTQEELAAKLYITRGAISKWEKGKRIPEIDSLKELSKIFNVSIDEILLGERDSKSNLTLTLYEESLHLRKVLKIFLYLLISLIFGFLLYYFFQLYKSINIYTIYGFGNNFNVNGLLVKTNEKLYFNIGNINKKHEFKINKIQLLLKEKKYQVIYETNSETILLLYDYKGYNEYFDMNNFKEILNNLYIDINYENNDELIKLDFVEDYINDNLFFKSDENITHLKKSESQQYSSLENSILNKFKKQDKIYKFEINSKNKVLKYFYNINERILTINIINSQKLDEELIFDFKTETLTYNNYNNNSSMLCNEICNCVFGNCSNIDAIKIYQNSIKFLK